MSMKIKNIAQSEVLTLKAQISYQEGQVVSRTLAQNPAVSITLFSFDEGRGNQHPRIRRRRLCHLPGRRWDKSPLTAQTICCTKGNPSSCQPDTPMRLWTEKHSRCFWWLYFNRA